jgi:thioredoxin 1
MATRELTATNFDDTVTGSDIVLVDFWAEWCGPCRMFGPVFEKASETHPDIVFGKVDTEAEQQLAAAASITSIPTLMAFREGVLLYAEAGALPGPQLEQLIEAVRAVDMEKVHAEIAAQDHEGHDHSDHDGHDHSGHDHSAH